MVINMGLIVSDAQKMIKAAELSSRGHHGQASSIYRGMANQERNPSEKEALHKLADNSRKTWLMD